MSKNLLEYAKIKSDGSILLGNHTVVDGFEPGRLDSDPKSPTYNQVVGKRAIGVFSHIHQDHTRLWASAMQNCDTIFVSPPTFDMLAAYDQDETNNVSSECYFGGRHVKRLDFTKTKVPELNTRELNREKKFGDSVTLYEAHHVLGSAQVKVTTCDETNIVYSGDFTHPKTEPIPCDVLVLDSTHGHPMFNTVVDNDSLENTLVTLIEQEIATNHPVCIRAHVGRLQYLMHILSDRIADDIKFLCSNSKHKKLIPVYRKYKMGIRNVLDPEHSIEGEDAMYGSYPFIEFKSKNEAPSKAEWDKRSTVFHIGGEYLGDKIPITQKKSTEFKEINEREYKLEFGDHGNYESILNYVRGCEPKLVITDNYRSSWGESLAERINDELQDELQITAISQP